jgi:2-polyprenyl-6-methoxyphenol hydroxylase-like FAD-dependent oxidoreductase
MYELGLLEDFLKVPHQKVTTVGGVLGGFAFQAADVRYVPAHCKFVALMPQWDFLNFLVERAKRFPSFRIAMHHEVFDLIFEHGRIAGVVVRTPDGVVQIRTDLVVGCDGRHAVTRQAAGLDLIESGVPIDVLWFRISRKPADSDQLFGSINYGKALILINRGDYFQAGLIIRKDSFPEMQQNGLGALRSAIAQIAPHLQDRVEELQTWDQVKLLSVQINRLRKWHLPGLLCIGDAAHAMSPAGGVGINLAIQDAVATANLLTDSLRRRYVPEAMLARVQQRREFPARMTQRVQVLAHKGFEYVFQHPSELKAPWQFKAAVRIPGIQLLIGRMVGMGVRPEHIRDRKPSGGPSALRRIAICTGVAIGVAVRIVRGLRAAY